MSRPLLAPVTKRHTTFTDTARWIADAARRIPNVTRIACGAIKPGGRSGHKRVKILNEEGCVLLRVVGDAAKQEMRIYANGEHMSGVKTALIDIVTRMRIPIADTT